MTKHDAWEYAIGLIKVDGLEPTDDFLRLVEQEKRGEITTAEMKRLLDEKYRMKGTEHA